MNNSLTSRIGRLFLVHETELPRAVYFFVLCLIIGMGLALGRGTSDALFFKRYGIEYLPVIYLIHAVSLAVTTTAYAAFVDRLPAERLLRIMLGALTGLLVVHWIAIVVLEAAIAYPLYYLLYEVASDLLMLHVGVYLAQNFDAQQAKRLTSLIFAGAQIGIIGGGMVLVLGTRALGVPQLLLLWGALTLAALGLLEWQHRTKGVSPHFRPGRKGHGGITQAVTQIAQGLAFARRSPLLRWSSVALFFTVFAFYITTFSVSRIYAEAFTTEEALTSFFGWLAVATGSLAIILQLLLTNRLLQRLGVRGVNLIFPISTLLSILWLLLSYSLPAAVFGSVNKDSLMKAFRNPTRNLLFNALPGSMQGRARAFASGFVMPVGLALTAGVLLLTQSLASPLYFLLAGFAAAALYLFCNLQANRAYAAGILQLLRNRLYVPDDGSGAPNRSTSEAQGAIHRYVSHEDDELAIASATKLAEQDPASAIEQILARLATASLRTQDRLLKLLLQLDPARAHDCLRRVLEHADDHLRGTLFERLYATRDPRAQADVETLLGSENPRLAALGVYGVQQYGLARWQARADATLASLFQTEDPGALVAALEQVARQPALQHEADLLRLASHTDARVRARALTTIASWPNHGIPGLTAILTRSSRDKDLDVRRATARCYRQLSLPERRRLCFLAIEDLDPVVRDRAACALMSCGAAVADELITWLQGRQGSPRAQVSVLDVLLRHDLPRASLEQIALCKVQQARDCVHNRRCLERVNDVGVDPVGRELLHIVLTERAQQGVDLALTAISRVEGPGVVGLIRAGLHSGDRRDIASASEAIRHLENRPLAGMLAEVLEEIEPTGLRTARYHASSVADAGLAELASVGDPWLCACVDRARIPAATVAS
jgi:ATP/ADP translocase